jgi:hypothetical protein
MFGPVPVWISSAALCGPRRVVGVVLLCVARLARLGVSFWHGINCACRGSIGAFFCSAFSAAGTCAAVVGSGCGPGGSLLSVLACSQSHVPRDSGCGTVVLSDHFLY